MIAIDQREAIVTALQAFDNQSLVDASCHLLDTLGYASKRRIPVETPRQFCDELDPQGRLTDKEREAIESLQSLHLLFQFTDHELDTHDDFFVDSNEVQTTKMESYMFFAAELPPGRYTRTDLSTLVRAINKPLPMPALILFRHDGALSIGIIHRRLNKREQYRDVLEKVTLIKDISCADPIRAHIEILNDFVLRKLDDDFGVPNFVRLHEAWQKRLGSYALSNDFYREIADWYFWAHHQVDDGTIRLPKHCDTEEENSLFLIRLLTRVIFCWFLVEKRLIPSDLFRGKRLREILKKFNPSKDPKKPDTDSNYYHAILQNLFFGTLNMPTDQRAFREKKKEGERYDKNYGITNLWRYETDFKDPAEWVALATRIPFLNGGLFDCLDDKTGKKKDNFILDGFSDRKDFGCDLPNDLFFGPERIVDLSKDYGEEDKRTARSKKAKVRGLIEVLSCYKFTIEENTPLEEEIALDPELLGKVFENLLASYNEDTRTTARKALGAFYTPREIVHYMVDESIKSYLSAQVPRCKLALEDLFSNKATLKEINPDTREALIAAIGRVKILDPACGSGAFPMGALHRLVDLLQKLDPNNESWKRDRLAEARRYREILEDSGAAQEEIDACDNRIADIEKSFDTRFHALDFARKLYLIENCIYGVDIQPIATQIAKLRFFISLIVDQKVKPDERNLGVRPLPNLETRIVAADTLIPIEKSKAHQFDLLDQETRPLRRELAQVRHEHFNARSPQDKRKCRERDAELRERLATLLRQNGLPSGSSTMLADWDPYDQNAHAGFFDNDWMFGKSPAETALITEYNKGGDGFDIVIGNPPYIRLQTLKQSNPNAVKFYREHYSSAAKGNYDIYVVFIEAGLKLLKSDGHLAYICPHKFFNAQYGEPLRRYISKGKHLQHIVHFGDEQVFPGATIYTCLLFLSRENCSECRVVRADDLQAWMATRAGVEGKISSETLTDAEWNLPVGPGADVYETLSSMPIKLGDIAEIFVGLQTSADTIFLFKESQLSSRKLTTVVSKQTGDAVDIETALLKPVVRSGELGRYWAQPTALVLFPYILTKDDVQLIPAETMASEYPAAWSYLKTHKKLLAGREKGAFNDASWYRFGRAQNIGQWEQSKIMLPYMITELSAYFDSGGTYFVNVTTGGFGITSHKKGLNIEWMTVLLNSQLLDWFLKKVSTTFHGGYFAANKQYLVQLPIAEARDYEQQIAIPICRWLHTAKATMPAERQFTRDPLMLAYWERVLNGLVYELYFPEELHAADLHLFDLVAKAKLPAIDDIPESERLPRLRTLFEDLYDGAHPLRIALDKLQTLDTVRIIEGKA